MDNLEQAVKIAESYGISDGFRTTVESGIIIVDGEYFCLVLNTNSKELATHVKSCDDIITCEQIADEAAAFSNLEDELKTLL